jgi:formylglycine-generating enzyme required for sulfatase activity
MVRRVAFWVALVVWGASDGVQAFNIEERERALAEAKKAQAERERALEAKKAQAERDRARQAEPPQKKPTPRPVENKKPPRRTSVQPVVSETESSRGERECVHGVCFDMVALPAGSFQMGSPDTELGRDSDEGPVHTVNVKGFWLGKTEVTQGLWKAVMGSNPSSFKDCGDNCPVERVSWDDAQEFIKKLNGLTGKKYRLPSESEWEYGARAGTKTEFSTGSKIEPTQANFDGNFTYNGSQEGAYRQKTAAACSFAASPWGLCDMHGNVYEWVQDAYVDNYNGAPTDGSAREGNNGVARVLRGGSWDFIPQFLRSANRNWFSPVDRNFNWGVRLARTN